MATAAILPGPAHALPAKAVPQFEQRVIFRASQDPGYACFRIPAIVQTTRGTLLAFAEGRVRTCGDAGDIDIVLKRSTDGGRTWGPLQVVSEGAGDTHGNPAPIVDRRTGRILLPQTHNPASADGTSCAVPCARRPHLQYSDDDGSTWTRPRDLSAQIMPPHWNSWYATGPVHGIQLTRGSHPGRLVFGVNTETWNGSRVTANHAALISSDDGGNTWQRRATDSWLVATDGTFRQKPSEITLTEHTDGTILVSGREQDGTDLGHRAQTFSRDGGDTFTTRFRSLPDLYTPQVQGSTL
ncbi:hypothetical protein GCM10022233_55930 [Streptomyces shaanxiensis]|uniref:exo-alpha-sialidase n=1 Tax=Streptomyces shaanxiensis TaxID=653357 RepID=A0ABP7VPN2_9ACTN